VGVWLLLWLLLVLLVLCKMGDRLPLLLLAVGGLMLRLSIKGDPTHLYAAHAARNTTAWITSPSPTLAPTQALTALRTLPRPTSLPRNRTIVSSIPIPTAHEVRRCSGSFFLAGPFARPTLLVRPTLRRHVHTKLIRASQLLHLPLLYRGGSKLG